MSFKSINRIIKPFTMLSVIGLSAWLVNSVFVVKPTDSTQSYIISSNNYQLLQTALEELNAKPSHELPIINAFAVNLTEFELNSLRKKVRIKFSENYSVKLAGGRAWGKRKWQPKAMVPDYIDATSAHHANNFGGGVTIGFLDTGLDQLSGLGNDLYGRDKAWGTYDAINNSVSNYDDEASGHGTHVASIAANSDYDVYGKIYGVAPNAAIVGIKAFDANGQATYADVIRGIDWALQVKDQINLKVLNMSFSGPVRSNYWDDPLNLAVMKAWQAGIVVVASAGNTGPDPMTIGVPGNVPYIITVGAMTDNFTTTDAYDDKLATFSAAGPTYEGFVKPEILAPGGHLSGLMSYDSQIVVEHPEYHDGGRYFEMSGTSQAAGVISGVVALMLTDNPTLTPDQVKCRLIASAHTARTESGSLAYSVFQQGAGVVNVSDALNSSAVDCANTDLNITQDLAGEQHFSGPANINDDGNFYIEGLGDEYIWDITGSVTDSETTNDVEIDRLIWKTGFNVDRLIWKTNLEVDRLIWKTNLEVDRLIWKTNVDFNNNEEIKVNNWVEQQ
ncbi:S8 family peptidase [Thalassotalea nanhaiensis]|uniref:S8 family peptidase n=1 Tax=Thalassotalea nanhaiensis TaxID=3065648 RepID=A0ABY9TLK2_9GAMM|nr:S8 family peptidase [Colwelliaceae bacterium SQ345]